MTKNEIRQKVLSERIITDEKNIVIRQKLFALNEFLNSELVLCYVSRKNEIDTLRIISHCFGQKKKIAVPKINSGNNLDFYIIKSFADLSPSSFGILEPSEKLENLEIVKDFSGSVCVVPALACNYNGFRIGYGKGFYDKFLRNYSGFSIALCLSENIYDFQPENHDVTVNLIIKN